MKTITDFKNLMQPNTEWHTTHEYLDANNNPTSNTDMGIRVCAVNRSADFGFKTERGISYAAWPKKSELTIMADNKVSITKAAFCRLTYTLIKGE